MTRSRASSLVGAVAILAIAIAAAWLSVGPATSDPGDAALFRVSARGVPVELPLTDVRTSRLRASGFSEVARLATRERRAYYRLKLSSGNECYGAGDASDVWPIGVIKCVRSGAPFPSAARPMLDLSVVDLTDGGARFTRVQGFAADGVSKIALVDTAGGTVATLPLVDNVYWLGNPPASAASLRALDADGAEVATLP